MTPEEFLNEHGQVLNEALGVYVNKMEANAGEMGILRKNTAPKRRDYKDIEEDFYTQRDRAKAALQAMFRMFDWDGAGKLVLKPQRRSERIEIGALGTAEVILEDVDEEVSVRVTGTGDLLVNVIDSEGNEKGFFEKIRDIVKSPEEMEA